MSMPSAIPIQDCAIVPIRRNSDARGCLFEIFRESWDGAFRAVQWNACSSAAGVIRGVHVHVDYDEFYTLPRGKVILGLADIRKESPTFGVRFQCEWSDTDGVAVVVPIGVAHVVYFVEDSVLVFGLSDYWRAEFDVLGCQWDDPELGFDWSEEAPLRSRRDQASGRYRQMIADFEEKRRSLHLVVSSLSR